MQAFEGFKIKKTVHNKSRRKEMAKKAKKKNKTKGTVLTIILTLLNLRSSKWNKTILPPRRKNEKRR